MSSGPVIHSTITSYVIVTIQHIFKGGCWCRLKEHFPIKYFSKYALSLAALGHREHVKCLRQNVGNTGKASVCFIDTATIVS